MLWLTRDEPKELDADFSTVFYSEPGDKFYLLVLKGKEKDKILKCFNARYYAVFDDDFDYRENKYYPKKEG